MMPVFFLKFQLFFVRCYTKELQVEEVCFLLIF